MTIWEHAADIAGTLLGVGLAHLLVRRITRRRICWHCPHCHASASTEVPRRHQAPAQAAMDALAFEHLDAFHDAAPAADAGRASGARPSLPIHRR